jgi:hypothetical protein
MPKYIDVVHSDATSGGDAYFEMLAGGAFTSTSGRNQYVATSDVHSVMIPWGPQFPWYDVHMDSDLDNLDFVQMPGTMTNFYMQGCPLMVPTSCLRLRQSPKFGPTGVTPVDGSPLAEVYGHHYNTASVMAKRAAHASGKNFSFSMGPRTYWRDVDAPGTGSGLGVGMNKNTELAWDVFCALEAMGATHTFDPAVHMFRYIRTALLGGTESHTLMTPDEWTFVWYNPTNNCISAVERYCRMAPSTFSVFDVGKFGNVGWQSASTYYIKTIASENPWRWNQHEDYMALEQTVNLDLRNLLGATSSSIQLEFNMGVGSIHSLSNSTTYLTTTNCGPGGPLDASRNVHTSTNVPESPGPIDVQTFVSYIGVGVVPRSDTTTISATSAHHAMYTYDGFKLRDCIWPVTSSADASVRYLMPGDRTMMRLDDSSPHLDAWRLDLAGDVALTGRYSVDDPDYGRIVKFADQTVAGTNRVLKYEVDSQGTVKRTSFYQGGSCSDEVLTFLNPTSTALLLPITRGLVWYLPDSGYATLPGDVPYVKITN